MFAKYPMRSFLRAFFQRPFQPSRQYRLFQNNATKMSASTAAVLYASVISSSQITGAIPEDAKDKPHHLKDGKGFRNPWDSYLDRSFFQVIIPMLKYDNRSLTVLCFIMLKNCSQTTPIRSRQQTRYDAAYRPHPLTLLPTY